jgi:hypothetical protein
VQTEKPRLTGAPALSVSEMIVTGSDNAGRRMASMLRKLIGSEAVLKDLNLYGIASRANANELEKDQAFWAYLSPQWQPRLAPAASSVSLTAETTTPEWEDALSIGEIKFSITALHLSRFLQAVGNDGVMLAPFAQTESGRRNSASTRVMNKAAALKLQAAMRAVVQRGTAKSIASLLAGTGWQIGGKTGTGPGPAPIGPNSDGWFAGLIFDPKGRARFTVATFVKHGGVGGGNAAKISAQLARFILGYEVALIDESVGNTITTPMIAPPMTSTVSSPVTTNDHEPGGNSPMRAWLGVAGVG